MKRFALSEVKDRLSEYLDLAKKEEVLITRHGKPAGVLIGFGSEEDWFDYRLEHDPRFLARISAARRSLRERERGTNRRPFRMNLPPFSIRLAPHYPCQ